MYATVVGIGGAEAAIECGKQHEASPSVSHGDDGGSPVPFACRIKCVSCSSPQQVAVSNTVLTER
jgi:hypothetical protein